MTSRRPELAGLAIADPPQRWEALGFALDDERLTLGGVVVALGVAGRGITGWTLRHAQVAGGVGECGEIGGLATQTSWRPVADAVVHPNGARAVDHVVVVSPEFDQMAASLAAAGMPLRRIRDAGGGVRQGFRRLGPAILELVEALAAPVSAFWGLVIVVGDLQALRERLAPHLGEIRDAVQPGRHIATLGKSAGLSTRLAFMDPIAGPPTGGY